MIDIDAQVRYWREGGQEDWAVACELIEKGRIRHGLFFAHLALEKLLKAHVCRHTRDLAPRVHTLARLVEKAGLQPSPEHTNVLADMNAFNLEGRYPGYAGPSLERSEVDAIMAGAKEVVEWLTETL